MFGQATSGTRWKLFSIAGNDIYVTPFFLLLIAFFSFMGLQAGGGAIALANILVWAPVLFFGVLLHELGHAFAMQYFGYGASTIILHGFGGVTINRRRQHSPPGHSIAISLAGPITSFLLGVAFVAAMIATGHPVGNLGIYLMAGQVHVEFLNTMAVINIFWAIFNMIPINPMDGGHVVLHALRKLLGDERKAMYYSALSSLVILALMVPLGLMFTGSVIFLLLIAGMFGLQNWQILKATSQPHRRR